MPAPGDRYDGDSSSTEDDENVRAYASAARNGAAPSRNQYSYSNLFRLDSLVNLQLPSVADDNYSSSGSEDQTNSGEGSWRLNGHVNGSGAERPSDIKSEMTMKRKRLPVEADAGRNSARRDNSGSNDEDEQDITVSEGHYRNLLSEHLQKVKRQRLLKFVSARPLGQANRKRDRANYGVTDAEPLDANGIESSNKQPAGAVKQYVRKSRGKKSDQDGGPSLTGSEPSKGLLMEQMSGPGMLDLNVAAPYEIPPSYDQLAPSFRVPDSASLETSDGTIRGNSNATSIVPMMVAEPWQVRAGTRGRMFEDVHEDVQPVGGMLRMFEEDTQSKVPLQVFERDMLSGFEAEASNAQGSGGSDGPGGEVSDEHGLEVLEGSQPGATMRHISSDGGLISRCEVKVIERGDGYEIIQRRIQKEETKRDPVILVKEDLDKFGRHWANLLRKDLPKHHKQFMNFHKRQLQDAKRFAEFCQREVKIRNIRSLKLLRSAAIRSRRLARDMVIFWKKVDKEQAELRKKEERDAADALKRNEELREAKRQQQRLNFLLTQTELYSHFMQNKLAGGGNGSVDPASVALGTANAAAEEEEEETAALKEEAVRAATEAATKQMNKTNAFDNESSKLRHVADEENGDQESVPPDAVDDIDLLNPSTMPTTSSVQQPKLFQGNLKDYQLKGLQWLVNCYEQGLNGILADEMGLGKTIQAMAFLAHLAEEKNIWGPFLVVAPASVLNNWADEVNRFCPDLKILPYWGGLNERTVLRKNINPKRLYKREAVFHVLITSYQLLVSDEKYFRRVKWQYMILDEAQAIKSANSLRWKTLLSFNCRNRLLLTGTPIQNSMAELWALLHFIMPTLFDSHEQFSEWFSKGIESHAEHGGTLNEHQLTRLHAVLKPFMLRRVKKDVITEMTNKRELMVPCILSKRQQAFYQAIKNKISIADLFDSKGTMNEKKVLNLMNIVIQLRKVCNHPELFERNEGRSFFQFSSAANALLPSAFGELECIHYSGACNPIAYKVPKLLYRDGMRCLPTSSSGSCQGFREKWLRKRLSIYSADHIQDSIFPQTRSDGHKVTVSQGGFSFIRLMDLSPAEVEFLAMTSVQERWLYAVLRTDALWVKDYLAHPFSLPEGLSYEDSEDPKTSAVKRLLMVPSRSESGLLQKRHPTGPASKPFEALVTTSNERLLLNVGLLRSVRSYIPSVQAPQIDLVCADRGFAYQRTEELEDPAIHRLLVGLGRTSDRNGPGVPLPAHHLIEELDVQIKVEQPLLALPYQIFGSAPPVQSFDFAKMLTDSGKLHTLDGLLKRLRAENHRVLLFAQMTKMLNILEDYMNYRKYKYLRLDGSSTIMDRRDMVKDFQHRGDIFVFLLSTRAGGLGINLTAADTVIFYESDWNPTMDLQAMDRAHRLGQTKEVTVYRMICKGTVEEKILKRASQKNTVQQLVMTGGQSQGDVFQAEEVVSLLLDDAELEKRLQEQKGAKQTEKGDRRRKGWGGGSGMKGVRLDAEGGGASIDEEVMTVTAERPPGAATDATAGEGNAGAGELAPQKGGVRKRRRAEGKAPKPPRAPKPPKEPKAPKEPKVRRERKQPRIPRPPRDPRLPRARGRPKAKSEKSTPTTSVFHSETPASGSAMPDGVHQTQPMKTPVSNGEPSVDLNGALEPGSSPTLTSNGEHTNTTQNSAGSLEADLPLESETLGSEVPSNGEQDGGQEDTKSVGDGSVPGKVRSRGPKRLRKIPDLETNNGAPSSTKSKASHPLVGTLKLSLKQQPPAEKGLLLPAEDPL